MDQPNFLGDGDVLPELIHNRVSVRRPARAWQEAQLIHIQEPFKRPFSVPSLKYMSNQALRDLYTLREKTIPMHRNSCNGGPANGELRSGGRVILPSLVGLS